MSNIGQLSERLKSQIEIERQQIEQTCSDALKRHEQSLQALSDHAVSTTRRAIDRETQALIVALKHQAQQIERQSAALEASHLAAAQRLIWLMRLPLLIVLIACLTASAGIWGWHQYLARQVEWHTVRSDDGAIYRVMRGEWTTCSTPRGPVPCQRLGID